MGVFKVAYGQAWSQKGFDAETVSGLTAILGGLSPRNPVSPMQIG
jgi:hypothetical protein